MRLCISVTARCAVDRFGIIANIGGEESGVNSSRRITSCPAVNTVDSRSVIARYSVAVAAVILATIVRDAFRPFWGSNMLPFLFYFPAIVLAAWYGHFWPACLAIVLSAGVSKWLYLTTAVEAQTLAI